MSDMKVVERWEYYKKRLIDLQLEIFSYEDEKVILKAKGCEPALYLHVSSLDELGAIIKAYEYAERIYKAYGYSS